MSQKIPALKIRQVVPLLARLGFVAAKTGRDGHFVYKHEDGRIVSLPNHGGGYEMAPDVLVGILRRVNVTRKDILASLQK
jgi:predicted RNA binding protein YcfA (HicA-like mRNA interferase family)